ncbi:MAG: LLM class flavin-dependent oxidoreductase [Chloroflexi bacterium]|nr:LLM class flavin-dependent oxidoreductase [Chloroflexota bacterium]
MPVEIVGMVGADPPRSGSSLHVIGGGIDPDYLATFARAHEESGFDRVLTGYSSSSADGFLIGAHAAAATSTLKLLIAHRPGFVAPTLAARKAATLDQFTRGRVALHIISGGSDAEQRRDGDDLDHDERYARTAEYMQILRRVWTSSDPFDHDGRHYRFAGAYSDVRPYAGTIPLYYGGQSRAALGAVAYCDVFAMWGEPLAAVREKIDEVRAAAAPAGVKPRFSVSFRPIIAVTEDEAWEKARRVLAGVRESARSGAGRVPLGSSAPRPEAEGSRRLLALAAEKEIHDERLWLPIAGATGAPGNTSALVGTPRQVADALMKYYELGVSTILIRGFDPLEDARAYGRELIPLLRAAVAERDAASAG